MPRSRPRGYAPRLQPTSPRMTTPEPDVITRLLHSVRAGDADAVAALLALTYEELGQLARVHFASQRQGHTLQPTALIHEAWLKLAGHIDRVGDRQHFFAIASRAMRQVLADHARGKNRMKRQGPHERVTLDQAVGKADTRDVDLVDLDDSLRRLAALNERHARVVELRIFGGLTIAETAEELAVSHDTVEKAWFMARAWLQTELGRTG